MGRLFSHMIMRLVTSAVLLTFIFLPKSARADQLWGTDPLWPLGVASASGTVEPAGFAASILLDGGWSPGLVPPFRVAERDRLTAGVTARVALFDRVQLAADWGWLSDRTADGTATTGPGDLRLGTVVRVARVAGIDLHAGWEVKLPNAADEGELGTDETDITLGIGADWQGGPWLVGGSAGLGVWGNPLRFANQDDVPLLQLHAAWTSGLLTVAPAVRAELATSRNPARVEVGAQARFGRRWFGWAAGAAGLTPAAADGNVSIGLGWRHGYGAGG